MQRNKVRRGIVVIAVLICSLSGIYAQNTGSSAVYSPYTMYGLGDMRSTSILSNRAMGGVGIAYRHFGDFNYQNPASLSSIKQQTALFQFGLSGQNFYSKTVAQDIYGNNYTSSGAYNNFELNDLSFAIPLARGIGFGVSMTPISSIGYKSSYVDETSDVVQNIGRAIYTYSGEGGISAVTGSFGISVFKGLSLGANLIYYFGTLDRYYNADIIPMLDNGNYNAIRTYEKTNISRLNYSVGFQYSARVSRTGWLTVGGTFNPRTDFNTKIKKETMTVFQSIIDTVGMSSTPYKISMPAKWGAGVMFQSQTWSLGADYIYQDWRNAFNTNSPDITLGVMQEIKLGASFTPNRADIRHALNRWTYKLGVRYATNYLIKNGEQLNDIAISLGFDIPLRANSNSKVSVGAEFGKRGSQTYGQVQEQYIKIFLGVTFFGDDRWFYKPKFN